MAEMACPVRLNCLVETDRLSLNPSDGAYDIVDNKTCEVIGRVSQPIESRYQIELFHGKGGFTAIITSPNGLKYFALPGSNIQVGDVDLSLVGQPITPNPIKRKSAVSRERVQSHTVQATILGAGLATRFEPISGENTGYSKPAIPLVGEQSVIECIANALVQDGFTHLIVNTYFKRESLKVSLARSSAKDVCYIDEEEPSGTAGGLRKMLSDPKFQGLLNEQEPLLVVQGDAVTDANFSELMEAHIANDALLTIGCQVVDEEDVDKFGIIVTDKSGSDGESGQVIGFQEKPRREDAKSRLANTGFYIFSPSAYPIVREIYAQHLAAEQAKAKEEGKPVPQEVLFDFAMHIFPNLLRRVQENPGLGKFLAQSVQGYWSDIGNPTQYIESIHDIHAGKVNIPLPENNGVYYRNGLIFWQGAAELAEQEDATLQGNVVVARPFSHS